MDLVSFDKGTYFVIVPAIPFDLLVKITLPSLLALLPISIRVRNPLLQLICNDVPPFGAELAHKDVYEHVFFGQPRDTENSLRILNLIILRHYGIG